jgi:hypothetical protein
MCPEIEAIHGIVIMSKETRDEFLLITHYRRYLK